MSINALKPYDFPAKDVREKFLIYRYMPHEDTVGNP